MLPDVVEDVGERRFIPTRVGNAPDADEPGIKAAVHPHACGECFLTTRNPTTSPGSSPRVWGMQGGEGLVARNPRFIPTRVGNAPFRSRRTLPAPVHPHACGECCTGPPREPLRAGSSPRVWGMQNFPSWTSPRSRFIPTRVGNALPRPEQCGDSPVHPHACGECKASVLGVALGAGSSPRVWGMQSSPRNQCFQ